MSKIRVGIPTNEKVFPEVQKILIRSTMRHPEQEPRQFIVRADDTEYVFARMSEIARLTLFGYIDCGFVTWDCWTEAIIPIVCQRSGVGAWIKVPQALKEFSDLCRCTIAFIAPRATRLDGISSENGIVHGILRHPKSRGQARIATRFPCITEEALSVRSLPNTVSYAKHPMSGEDILNQCSIDTVDGSEELYVLLGAADFAVVQIETGQTLQVNNLQVIQEIMWSHLLLVGAPNHQAKKFAACLR